MRYQAVIFDLDGTLLNTLGDIAEAANQALAEGGYPPHDHETYRYFIGNGSRMLVKRALPEGHKAEDNIERTLKRYLDAYKSAWDRLTRPYDGIMDLLFALRELGPPLAVVTNKPDELARLMVQRYFPEIPFFQVRGARPDTPVKPDPTAALVVAEEMGLAPREIMFVGDMQIDMQTAVSAGMHPVGAAWGFRAREELLQAGAADIIDHPSQALKLL